MSILPMKICKKCDHIFKSPGIRPNITCPRCGSKSVTAASDADIAYKKKLDKKNKK